MGAGAIWLPFSFVGDWIWMPRAVKISGWIGLVFSDLWLIVSAVGLANPPDPEFDGLVVQFLLAGAVGVILSLGLMRRELWAFRTFVAFIWPTVAIFSCYMCVAKSIGQVAWAGVFAVALLLWRLWLPTKEVRTFFGLSTGTATPAGASLDQPFRRRSVGTGLVLASTDTRLWLLA